MGQRRVLLLTHSFTGQTRRVMDRLRASLTAGGHLTLDKEIRPIEPWDRPVGRVAFLWRNAECWAGMDMSMPVHPLGLDPASFDHVVLGLQTWHLNPAFPVDTFLRSDEAEALRGKKVTVVLTCRNRYKAALEITLRRLLQRGAQVAGVYVLSNPPGHMLPTLYYLFNMKDPAPGSFFARRAERPFAFSDADIETVGPFADELARRLSDGSVSAMPTTVVNDQDQ